MLIIKPPSIGSGRAFPSWVVPHSPDVGPSVGFGRTLGLCRREPVEDRGPSAMIAGPLRLEKGRKELRDDEALGVTSLDFFKLLVQ
jgi:hypothetical protein